MPRIFCRFCGVWAGGKDVCKKVRCLASHKAAMIAAELTTSRAARRKYRRLHGLPPEAPIPQEVSSLP